MKTFYILAEMQTKIGAKHNLEITSTHESSGGKVLPGEKQSLKRMAQEIEEEDQSKKRRKWMRNLSVLSSEDEEEYLCNRPKNEESIFSNDKVIYLRFPYRMGSDNSEDEDDIICSAVKFPSKEEKNVTVSSSDDKNESSKEKLAYKRSKRKSKISSGLKNNPGLNLSLNNKENKESLKKNLKSRNQKSMYKSPVRWNSSKYDKNTKDISCPSHYGKDKTKHISKTTSLNRRKTRAFGSVDGNLIEEKDFNNEECAFREDEHEEFQSQNQTSNRFLDSSSENSNTEIITKPKRPKYRRIRYLSTSSSGSNDEEDTVQPQDLQTCRNTDSEEENNSEPSIKSKCEKELKDDCNKEAAVGISALNGVCKQSQTIKPKINANAWKSIAIADIKAQFSKQSKVDELKRKFVPSNASSVAIYKNIKKRQMFTNHNTKLQRPVPKPQLSRKHTILQKKERSPCDVRTGAVPTKSDLKTQKQTLSGTPSLMVQAKESNDAVVIESPAPTVNVLESNTEKPGEHTENQNLSNSQLQSNLEQSPLDSDTGISVYNKKIRQAHNIGPKNQSENFVFNKFNLQNKVSSSNFKQTQPSNENKPKISKQTSHNTSTSCDVLSNIMSEMDNNRYKVQKPLNKKIESSSEKLGWFPSGTSASPLIGQLPVAAGAQSNSTRGNEVQSKHSQPIGMHLPAVNNRPLPVTINNAMLPSYNPLSFVVACDSNTRQSNVGIVKQTDNQVRNQEASTLSNNQQLSKNCEQNQENTSNIFPKLSSEGNMIPFYSAPQEDYVSKEISKPEMHNAQKSISELSSDCKTSQNSNEKEILLSIDTVKLSDKSSNMQNQSSNDKGMIPLSLDIAKLSDRLLNMQHNKHQTKASNVSKASVRSKDSLPSTNRKENAIQLAESESAYLQKLNSEKNILLTTEQKDEPVTIPYFQPHVPSSFGVPRGNGVIRNEFKRNSLNSNNSIVQKGIRVRFGGTEFRITPKEFKHPQNSATKSSETNANLSDKVPPETSHVTEQTSSVNTLEVKHNKNTANESEGAPVESSSSSSSSSSPSSSYTSSSTTDSSSESSDESEKPSSTESSASDSLDASSKYSVLKEKTNIDKTNQKITSAENVHPQNESSKSSSLTRPTTETFPITPGLKNRGNKFHAVSKIDVPQQSNNKVNKQRTSKNITVDEVIVLSGSSDSDNNDQPHHKETSSQNQDEVSITTKTSENQLVHLEDSTVVGTPSQSEQSKINSAKVGKIRVKSLKELGVSLGTCVIGNALEPTKDHNSQILRGKNQANQPDIPSCSSVNIETHQKRQSEKAVSNIQLPSKNHVKLKSAVGQPLKKTSNPVSTIYVPVIPIAVINPINSVRVIPTASDQGKKQESNSMDRSGDSSQVTAVTAAPLPDTPSQTVGPLSSEPNNQEASQSLASLEITPSLLPPPCGDIVGLFFKRCDELFTEVVLFKIPKLADDLHLLIAYDLMKEERLKKIEQLISPETIICEKRRAEKDFADMIKVRGHSFVPLFLTIVNRIDKDNLKTLVTAVYCRIVQQLERLDPVNCIYRYKIRNIIKSMLLKHNPGVRQDILAYFDEETNSNFLSHFIFIENLLSEYDKYLEKQKEIQSNDSVSETHPVVETQESNDPTGKKSQDGNSSLEEDPLHSNHINLSASNTVSAQAPTAPVKPTPPAIGNLDQLFLKKNVKK